MNRQDPRADQWLVIDPLIERAVLIALIRRHGEYVALDVDELRAAAGDWSLEGVRVPEAPETVHIRLRRAPRAGESI